MHLWESQVYRLHKNNIFVFITRFTNNDISIVCAKNYGKCYRSVSMSCSKHTGLKLTQTGRLVYETELQIRFCGQL